MVTQTLALLIFGSWPVVFIAGTLLVMARNERVRRQYILNDSLRALGIVANTRGRR